MEMKKNVLMCGCAVVLMSVAVLAQAHDWKTIDKGLAHTVVNNVHVFQIDPKILKLSVVTAKDFGETDSTAEILAKKSEALLAVNGGFFSPTHQSLGLLMRNGHIINPLHTTSWWAIFQISKEKPSIVPLRFFIPDPAIEMALQVGPRLVVNGEIPKLKPSVARRSGIGIRADGRILLAVTEDVEITMEDFARLFQKPEKEGGLECRDALNLDGGGSTQLYFSWKGSKIDVPGIARITNAVTVSPR